MGTNHQLIIKVPTPGFVGWADTMRTDTFVKIAEHDHTGSGKGLQIATAALATDAVTDTKILLANNAFMRGRNAADGADINIVKVDTSDRIVLGDASTMTLPDAAITLADNQSAITTGIVTLGTDESCAVHYRIVRNGVTQSGVLRFTDVETIPAETYVGTSVGVTFTVASGVLKYATTSTGNTGSMTYVLVKE